MLIACSILLLSIVAHARAQCSDGIAAAEVNGFLTAHNKMRQSISAGDYIAKGRRMPAAKTDIPDLSWDCGLEKSAQSVVNACKFEHSAFSKTLGENLYMVTGGTASFAGKGKEASDDWEHEFQQFGWPGVLLTRAIYDSGVGHATQMAWAKTTKMGCGMASCSGARVIVACHYRDAGNFIGQNVYEPEGAPTVVEEPDEATPEEEEEEATTEGADEEDTTDNADEEDTTDNADNENVKHHHHHHHHYDNDVKVPIGELVKNFFIALHKTKESSSA